jgi:hypothetical protein
MTQSHIPTRGIRSWAFIVAASLALVALLPHRGAAQQDTTRHPMPGMMPGMQMSKPATTQKPKARAKRSTSRKTAGKATAKPSVKDTVEAKPPAKDTSMKGMAMPSPSDAGRPDDAHARHAMPGMRMGPDTTRMPGMRMGDTTAGARATPMGQMGGMHMMTPDPLGVSMDRMGSGTTWVPDAAPIPSLYFTAPGHWDVTGHGFAFAQYDKQGGTRGGEQLGSLNWMMLMASHSLAGGRVQARTMLSLDALTVTPKGYPLLLQSGEAYDGQPLHDRQHPHDFFMELSMLYEKPITRSVGVMLYAAPSGEPALGPVAFMHRPSAMDNPTAPISHHWQDATHISFGVFSAGLFTHTLKLEGSLFNGREPDQYRFNFDPIRLDSYSGRVTYDPSASWSFTGGYGYLKSPEALNPTESMHRVTASALYGATLGSEGQWSASAVWGANAHSTHPGLSHAVLLESEAVLDARNTVFGRAEVVQKSAGDLVLDTPQYGFATDREFRVGELTLGYIRDFARFGAGTLGLGAMGTLNVVPPELQAAYGSRTPVGALVFLRVRPFRTGMSMQGPMEPGMSHDVH